MTIRGRYHGSTLNFQKARAQSTSDAAIIPAISAVPAPVICPTRTATMNPALTAAAAHQRDIGFSAISSDTQVIPSTVPIGPNGRDRNVGVSGILPLTESWGSGSYGLGQLGAGVSVMFL